MRLALAASGEIVGCDSLHVYRGLDIGSAKPTPRERAAVRHHLLDVVDPGQEFSAAEYARLARVAVREIAARGRLPVVVGGTGLYLKAFLEGLFEGPARDASLRSRLTRLADRYGDARVHRWLGRVDPEAAARIAPRDRIRVVRALEVYLASGQPISAAQRQTGEPLAGFSVRIVGLRPDRATLKDAVEARTRAMLEAGLVDEVMALRAAGVGGHLRPLQAIGYRQAVAFLEGRLPAERLGPEIVTATLRYAKRQMTWFRHQAAVRWFEDAETARADTLEWLRPKG
jgi:tRNA dimethylallyltransferase